MPTSQSESSPLTYWNGPHGLPEFDKIADGDFAAAFDKAMGNHNKEIAAVTGNADAATLENTLEALELSGDALSRVSSIFWLNAGAHTNLEIQALEREISPKISRHYSAIGMNKSLFARIDSLYQNRDALGLDSETMRVIEKSWKGFVRAGARLEADAQKRLADINSTLALNGARFGQNVLADEKCWTLFVESADDLAGLPDALISSMKQAAAEAGRPDSHAVTLSRSIVEPFLTYAPNRSQREEAFRAWAARGENGGETDNRALVAETLALRAEKAKLLGYDSYAAYKLDDTMAKTPDAVNGLLTDVWERALRRASREAQELQALAQSAGQNHDIMPWDWRYYAEKLRAEKFAFNEAEIKPYLELGRMIEAAFKVAERLFGLKFEQLNNVTVWHPDVRAYTVKDERGAEVALFLGDYFARSSKRSGAWMSDLQSQYTLGEGSRPIIYNVMNFAKAPEGEPALLSFDDARTLFHEFGHALHGMLSKVKWPSVSGTSVSRDFVELPSQLYEHWLTAREVLSEYARHYKTNEPMPQVLIDKLTAARTFNAGFQTIEFTASAIVDMDAHKDGSAAKDPMAAEAGLLAKLNMPQGIIMRHRTPHFAHVYSGDGYSAGYYSYIWSEVLDADAFNAFEEEGDPFHAQTAEKLKRFIYSSGGSMDPEDAYVAFRGRMPKTEAMLKKRGLI
jgi:peptidyl-dipeptidase Dcp